MRSVDYQAQIPLSVSDVTVLVDGGGGGGVGAVVRYEMRFHFA